MESYQTVRQEAAGFYEVKRSKFHCYACPVTTQEEAQAFVQKIRAKHWDARHNVPAYVLRDGNLQHFSDDGEPSGTAGRPILDVILGHDVTDVVVVITRYFGGVLLGTGGLVRAYSHSAELALEAAGILTMAKMARCSLNVDYGLYGRLPALV
ncbi:MAG: YigZ family protein, partial [Clostridia bacterium]|nr:YigZ family protein [Clostridia bacterium]